MGIMLPSCHFWLWLLAPLFPKFLLAIPIDNGIEGIPEIECGRDRVTIAFSTRNPFEGQVYVRGQASQPNCKNQKSGQKLATIEVLFGTCNLERRRSLNPRGIFVTTTVVISFHPQFVTKIDRAFAIQCFYMEADKTVSAQLDISDITPPLDMSSQQAPMPVCKYEILDTSPQGEPIRFAVVGQQVYHKWTCVSETVDQFCMRVNSCVANDGGGTTTEYLNSDGCAVDRYVLRNLEYMTDLMAGQETHVFKYADQSQLFFSCQIAITIKEPDQPCPRPDCPEPTRGKRSVTTSAPLDDTSVVDVSTRMTTLDIDDSPDSDATWTGRTPQLGYKMFLPNESVVKKIYRKGVQEQLSYCLTPLGFGFIVSLLLVLMLSSTIAISLVCLSRKKREL